MALPFNVNPEDVAVVSLFQREMTAALAGMTLVRIGLLASGTVLVYDYFLTLDQEIALIWSNPLSPPSFMFFLNRYLPFLDTFINISANFSTSLSPQQCLVQAHAVIWLMFIVCYLPASMA
jgi:hypothetical protein